VRILLTGANGFIGSHLLAGLRVRGHTVVAAVRDPARLQRKVPGIEAIAVDFNRDTSPAAWLTRLTGIDAVVNCAGVLHGGRGQDLGAIHAVTPIALFDACVAAGVRKIVQITAISADADVNTAYAQTKKRADDHLRSLAAEWTVLRPSLVYGEGSYGGTSTIRGLAALPYLTPLPGDGLAPFRPIHVADVVATVVCVVETDRGKQRTLEPVGPQTVTLAAAVAKYRAWLGLPPAHEVHVPLPLLRAVARLVDLAGGGPMGTAAMQQLLAGNAGGEPDGVFASAIGFAPQSMDVWLARQPAQTQDLWHARLYFARPLLRIVLALLWLGSAAAGAVAPVTTYPAVDTALSEWGLPTRSLALVFCGIDLAIAAALLFRWRPRLLAVVQLLLVGGYTLGLTALAPSLWLDPFAALLKNLPILALIAVWAVLEEER
jgi:uncharacterized protein YbjT (DUF2867 family)